MGKIALKATQTAEPGFRFGGFVLRRTFGALLPALVLAGCALVQSPTERGAAIAADAGLEAVDVGSEWLRGFLRRGGGTAPRLAVYIESDGAPWIRKDRPPDNPTPIKPVVLRMAAADRGAAVAYLGRPCQFLEEATLDRCDTAWWTNGRFREDAVAMTNAAVERVKRLSGAARIDLIGYSGGGAMAALVAARRNDVACLVTMASPLDTNAWTDAIGVSRLVTSLNPADQAARLARLPQTHFRGGRDELVPPTSVSRFLVRVPSANVVDRPDFTHECCWDSAWLELRARTCLAQP